MSWRLPSWSRHSFCQSGVRRRLAARGKSPDRPCARDLASAGKARGGGDARASSTTSNAVRRRQTPGALRVAGGSHPSALLRLLDDAWASPASPRLVSGPAAPGTRPIRLLPRTARFDSEIGSAGGRFLCVRYVSSRSRHLQNVFRTSTRAKCLSLPGTRFQGA